MTDRANQIERAAVWTMFIAAGLVALFALCCASGCEAARPADVEAGLAATEQAAQRIEQGIDDARAQYEALPPADRDSDEGRRLLARIDQLERGLHEVNASVQAGRQLYEDWMADRNANDPDADAKALQQGGAVVGAAVGGPWGIGITLGASLIAATLGGVRQYQRRRAAEDAQQVAQDQAQRIVTAIETAKDDAGDVRLSHPDIKRRINAVMTESDRRLVDRVQAKIDAP